VLFLNTYKEKIVRHVTRPNLIKAPGSRILNSVSELQDQLFGLSVERLQQGQAVSQEFRFRVPEFYIQRVLQGNSDHPLVDIVLPSIEELNDGEERWDSTPSSYEVSDSPFWVQKYEYQGLLRLTTFCSGLCRFCYLKKKNVNTSVMRVNDVDKVFDDLEMRGGKLREIILSGGDPLAAPPDTLEAIGKRMVRLHSLFQDYAPHITVHTREPIWDPVRLMAKRSLQEALGVLKPKTFMLNVLHPAEVTPEFLDACAWLAEVGGTNARPALLCQHPLFRGVNDSVDILEELYAKLFIASPPVLPYYIVHPFYNGTLEKHKLTLAESQSIYRKLIRRPGCITPRLVVPTPWGKCVIGPHERLRRIGDAYQLTTKDGVRILYDESRNRIYRSH
jgi:L-lysine 2,3-aminomutase